VLGGIQRTVSVPLRDSGQTVAKGVLIAWWTGFAG